MIVDSLLVCSVLLNMLFGACLAISRAINRELVGALRDEKEKGDLVASMAFKDGYNKAAKKVGGEELD